MLGSRVRRRVVGALTVSASLMLLAGPAHAAIGDITEFPVPGTGTGGLNRITLGPDGNIWFTNPGTNEIGRMTPSGQFTGFPIPTPGSSPIDITTGPDGNIWFTEYEGRVGRITLTGQITEFPITRTPGGALANIFGITTGPDGALWFITDCCDPSNPGKIGRITTNGDRTLYPTTAGTTPMVGLTKGPDGNLWYPVTTAPHLDRIQRMTPAGVVNGNFDIPTQYADPSRIVTGPDGNLWFTEQGAVSGNLSPGKIGRITPAGVITEFTTPNQNPPSNPAGIAVGPDGNLWFTEYSYLRMNGMQQGGNRIGRITPSGVITEFPLPAPYRRADGITAGPDGAMYFTESPNNFTSGVIGRIQAVTPVVPPPPPPPQMPLIIDPARLIPQATTLTLSVTPKRKKKAPFRYRLSGRVALLGSTGKPPVCIGDVKLTLKKSSKTLASGTAKLSPNCTYSKRLTIGTKAAAGKRGTLAVRANYGGSIYLKASTKSATARLR